MPEGEAATLLAAGRTGQVARALAALQPPGWRILCRGRGDGLDIASLDSVRRTFDATEPRLVVNAAAYTAVDRAEAEPEATYAANRDGAAHLARACAEAGVPLIHLSTDYVFDGSDPAPYREDDPVNPLNVYGMSKLAGEEAVRSALDRHLILRTSWIYSPYGTNFVRTMLRRALGQGEIAVVADQRGRPTAAGDLAAAILDLAGQLARRPDPRFGTYHLAGGGETSWFGFAEAIFAIAADRNAQPKLRPIPTADYPTPARRPLNSRLDCGRIARDYAVRLPDWRESLSRCLDEILRETERA